MTFKVTVLGSGAAMPMPGKHHSAHALNVHEQFYLIDCGEGTQTRLLKYGISPMKLRAIFITHLHGDHLYGLLPLLDSMSLQGRERGLDLFGPAMLEEILEFNKRVLDTRYGFEIRFHAVDTAKHEIIYSNKVMDVWSVPLRHRTPAAGFLFREKSPSLNVRKEMIGKYGLTIREIVSAKAGEDIPRDDGTVISNDSVTYLPYRPRSYAYCSDTLYSGKVVSLVHGVDLLYHEATFSESDKALAKQTGHSTAAQAGQVALRAGAGRLLIGHFSARYKDPGLLLDEARKVFPETDEAVEGKEFVISPV